MKLYYSPGTCSLASHIVLRELGADFALEKVDTKTKKTEKGTDYWTVTSKGQVPALDVDGEVLTEGAAILQFIADSNGNTTLAPKPGTLARARVQELLNFTSSELHKAFGPLFHGETAAEKAAARKNVESKFDWLETLLADGRRFLTGNSFTVADAYAFVVTRWSQFVGISLEKWPHLKTFVERVAARPSAISAMKAEGIA